jgi:hypothetical protein
VHSYCRLFFQSWVYNTHFAEIRPHSCELATHVICGSFVTQFCSETLKLRLSENEASQPRNLKKSLEGGPSALGQCFAVCWRTVQSQVVFTGKVGLTDCSANDESVWDEYNIFMHSRNGAMNARVSPDQKLHILLHAQVLSYINTKSRFCINNYMALVVQNAAHSCDSGFCAHIELY